MTDSVDLIIPNNAEFNLRNFPPRFDRAAEANFIAAGDMLSDQAVFWSTGPRVLVLADGTDPEWFADVHRVLEVDPPPVVSPVRRTGRLVEDLLADESALDELRELLTSLRVRILCVGMAPAMYRLLATIQGWGIEVELDGPAQDDYWASVYLDNKLSCLDLAGRIPGFRVPPGVTVTTPMELEGALGALVRGGGQVIVKSMHGVSGDGSVVVGPAGVSPDTFWANAFHDPFLRTYPLLVQSYLDHAPDAGCPAVDILVTETGVESVVLSTMTVDVKRYESVAVGESCVPADLRAPLRTLGHEVGKAAHTLGYRGWLCADCLVDRQRELYVTEINARRSGAMHPIALLEHWGTGDPGSVAHSHDSIPAPPEPGGLSYAEHLRPCFDKLWADGYRVVPTAVRGLGRSAPIFAATAVAGDPATARSLIESIRCD
ncbi:hypothetical protein ACIP5Y_18585 [Nocardia sp. NPDC088792]|uniref:hypothetical protein n=1 Tax=Nocardia sp. NPDC088792 TaxID=3364332 RepID=UPI0037FEA267